MALLESLVDVLCGDVAIGGGWEILRPSVWRQQEQLKSVI